MQTLYMNKVLRWKHGNTKMINYISNYQAYSYLSIECWKSKQGVWMLDHDRNLEWFSWNSIEHTPDICCQDHCASFVLSQTGVVGWLTKSRNFDPDEADVLRWLIWCELFAWALGLICWDIYDIIVLRYISLSTLAETEQRLSSHFIQAKLLCNHIHMNVVMSADSFNLHLGTSMQNSRNYSAADHKPCFRDMRHSHVFFCDLESDGTCYEMVDELSFDYMISISFICTAVAHPSAFLVSYFVW